MNLGNKSDVRGPENAAKCVQPEVTNKFADQEGVRIESITLLFLYLPEAFPFGPAIIYGSLSKNRRECVHFAAIARGGSLYEFLSITYPPCCSFLRLLVKKAQAQKTLPAARPQAAEPTSRTVAVGGSATPAQQGGCGC